jgi:hypothetical protein
MSETDRKSVTVRFEDKTTRQQTAIGSTKIVKEIKEILQIERQT